MRDEHCITICFDIDLDETLEKAEALIETGESLGWTADVEDVVTANSRPDCRFNRDRLKCRPTVPRCYRPSTDSAVRSEPPEKGCVSS